MAMLRCARVTRLRGHANGATKAPISGSKCALGAAEYELIVGISYNPCWSSWHTTIVTLLPLRIKSQDTLLVLVRVLFELIMPLGKKQESAGPHAQVRYQPLSLSCCKLRKAITIISDNVKSDETC
eukprot:scaffold111862_cov31-Prasinocladus_malaysianus.AAC.1